MDPQPNLNAVWIQLIISVTTLITLIVVPIIQDRRARREAAKVKAELQTAKTEIKAHADKREAKLDEVAAKVSVTEKLVNGDRAAKEMRIKLLEQKCRMAGIDPE